MEQGRNIRSPLPENHGDRQALEVRSDADEDRGRYRDVVGAESEKGKESGEESEPPELRRPHVVAGFAPELHEIEGIAADLESCERHEWNDPIRQGRRIQMPRGEGRSRIHLPGLR